MGAPIQSAFQSDIARRVPRAIRRRPVPRARLHSRTHKLWAAFSLGWTSVERQSWSRATTVSHWGDHGEEGRGIFLYESTLHVPLIIRAPQIDPHRVSALISLADVAPTILDLMHLEAPRLDGRSLLPLLKDRGALPERVVYAESNVPHDASGGVPFGCSATSVSS